MPVAKQPEFPGHAPELARAGDKPVAIIAAEPGISESCLQRWMARDDVDHGVYRNPSVSAVSPRSAD